MNTLVKTIETPFPIKYHQNLQARKVLRMRRRRASISCKSEEPRPPSPSEFEGDARRQEILAKIAMLQAQKVRLTDFLDERSTYLTQFAEDANAEFDQIGETALKGLDEAEARIMENIENRMQAFEDNAESNRNDREKNDQKLAEFEEKIDVDRNEGLFFKNLTSQQQQPPSDSEKAYSQKEEMQKLRKVERENAGSKARRSIYLALICLLGLTILNALIITSPAVDWRKITGLGVILVALIAQLAYEEWMSSADAEKTDQEAMGGGGKKNNE